ncbi:hypothetical protein Dimus_039763 [Dionaea muscipula]
METNRDEEPFVSQHFMPQSFVPQPFVPPLFMPPPHIPSLAYDEQPRMPISGLPCESSHSSSAELFTPQVKDELVPKINQEFDSLDDFHKFYNTYAKESGFGTRSSSSRKNREDVIIRKEFCCSKEGVGLEIMTEESSRRRGVSRYGCGAKIAVVKRGEKYVVTQFIDGHNHPFTSPRRVHLLRSHRKVSTATRSLAESLSAVNMPICQQMSFFEMQSGGVEHVGFLQQDLYNVERDRIESVVGHDADMLYEYFQIEKEKNVGFTFAIEKDDEGRMTHCFWADATARKSYQYFGDVVVFDTTYNTKKYSLIFAPILGVNHHRQTTLFGCAFLSDETTESFEWLFEIWLKVMPADPPRMIITDQDPAMTKAISRTMPTTHHRFCIWHITIKFSEKISALSYKEYYEEFRHWIWNSETSEEFEWGWPQLVERANLSGNEWLKNLFKIRERWVPAYMKHIFSAHMTSSQRAESFHAFFKKYVSPNNSLLDFVTRFEREISCIRHNELDIDHKDVNESPHLKTMYPMEKAMSELYTHEIFYKFQEELFQNVAYKVTATNEDEEVCVYTVHRIKGSEMRTRQLVVDKSSDYVRCSCKMFESDRIPCRHMLAYFTRYQMEDLPNEYILRRWTKSTKAMRVKDGLSTGMNEIGDFSLLERRFKLFQLASNVIDEAIGTKERTRYVEEVLTTTQANLVHMKAASEDVDRSVIRSLSSVRDHISQEINLKEPLQVRAKGCGKRLKGGKEKATKKPRRCTGCGLTGQSHDKRNCPKLINASTQSTRLNEEVYRDEDEADNEDEDSDD